jgi:hypothetical protein
MGTAMPRQWSIPRPARPAIIVVVLLALTGWQLRSLNRAGERRAVEWLQLLSTDSLSREPVLVPAVRESEPVLSRLRQQLGAARARKAYHARLTIFFLSRNNSALTILLTSGLVAAGMLLLVTKSGWDQVSSYVKVTFVTATAIASFAGGFSSMYKQEANAARNASLYTSYDNLENRILTFMAGGRVSPADSAAGPRAFLASVDSSMAALNDLAIGFDESAAPSLDQLFKRFAVPGGAK